MMEQSRLASPGELSPTVAGASTLEAPYDETQIPPSLVRFDGRKHRLG